MKKIYLILVVSLLCFVGEAQIINIPDANFKLALLNYQPVIDTNNDGEIQVSEAQAVTSLQFNGTQIENLSGIQYFTNLQNLICNGNQITTIDLTGLNNLENLETSYNSVLSNLILSNLTSLTTLNCNGNSLLSNINFSGLTNLTVLNCSSNPNLVNFNISGLSNLLTLNCSGNKINNLNINNLNNLTSINCKNNLLTSLEYSNHTNLLSLDCSGNNLTTLTISGNSNLQLLNCEYNQLNTINLNGLPNLSNFNCGVNQITSLNLTNLNNLTVLKCQINQIQTLDVSNLTNLNQLYCFNNNISTLEVANLINLTELLTDNNYINSLNINSLVNLTRLTCDNNPLYTLNISNLINLVDLSCSNTQLSTLDVNMLINLQNLGCGNNPINTLDISNLVHLIGLDCSNNQLSTLDVTHQPNLGQLTCINNQLTLLDLSNNHVLYGAYFADNLFTELDFSNNPYLFHCLIQNNPNLNYLNLKNGSNINMGVNLNVNNCPNLTYICTDENEINDLSDFLNLNGITSAQLNSYCSFVPGGGIYNTINGTFTVDYNLNGCDTADYHPNYLKVTLNDAINSGSTFSNNGSYSFYTQSGNFTLTPQIQNNYFNVNPVSATLNFPLLDGSTQTQNFCITPNGIHNDLDITIIPLQPAQPGFDALYNIVFKNKGNQTLSGTINFQFNDAILDYITANPIVSSQSLNNLSWNFNNLIPFESRNIYLTLNLNAPTEIPPVNINDELVFTSTINPISGDETASDNVFNLNQIVVGSYDPNDKTCLEGTTISPTKIGDYLHYLIRFQNSGTAPATNIVVKDMIDATKFDINTLQLITTSHPQVTRITGNKVEFIFQGINLPAEQDNEPASHGFIAFKIKTKNNLVLGNSVSNTADIYFDYNFPIITNTATSTFTALGANEFENKSVSVYPNPTKNILTITAKENISFIQLFDIQGRLIETKLTTSTEAKFDMSRQLAGIYFVKVCTENGVKIEKIIKQ